MTTLNAQMLLEGVTPGDWHFRLEAVRTVIYHKADIGERAIAVGAGHYPDHVANARLIASAPRLARRVIELETERDAYMAALRWVYENGLPHDSKRPDFVNQAFSDAYAPNRAALKGEGE